MKNLKRYLNFNSQWVALTIFITASVIYLLPVFYNFSYWGIHDWDQTLSQSGVFRRIILRYHQVPLWKPYHAGGVPLSATYGQALSPFSPFSVFILLFGPVYGVKLQAIGYLIMGTMGMFLLSKQLNFKKYSCYLPAFVFMLNGFYALHFTAGHNYWDFIWLPWIFLYYFKYLGQPRVRYLILGAVFLVFMILAGEAYPALFSLLFIVLYSIFKVMKQGKRLFALKALALTLIITSLLGAIKLLPGLEQQREFPRVASLNPNQATDVGPHLVRIFLSRRQTTALAKTILDGEHYQEYGAYVGLIPLSLFFIGLFVGFRKYTALILTGLTFLILSVSDYASLDFWRILHSLPVFNNMHCPLRFIIMFTFVLAILSGVGLSQIEEMKDKIERIKIKKWWEKAILCILLLVLIDLIVINSRALKEAFIIPPMKIEEESDFYQTYDITKYRARYTPLWGNCDTYPALLKNKGVVNAYDNTPRPRNALVKESPIYRGESFLLKDTGRTHISHFSPNVVKVKVAISKYDTLVLNQNYDTGWRVKGAKDGKVISTKGLVSVAVTPEDHLITFYYLPTSFLVGALMSLFTVIIIILYRFGKLNQRHFKYSVTFLFLIFFLYLFLGIRYFAGASPENRSLILAKKYQWDEKYNQAMREWERVVATYPYYAWAYQPLGYCYLREKRYDKAMEVIKEAIKLHPNAWGNYHLLGATYYEKGDYDKAIGALKQAIKLAPQEGSNYHLLEACYHKKKGYDKAVNE